ncbi:Fis family transcriptional regulator [Rhodococcus pseudokoreensis]|uniref:Fis family transcriptional regulator n=1 Tax=Rhodococcus pseudokoreensis TaxID=2811421 RepID=A0A974ZW78_9NOCA|nr:helix-turn-helix domain-containing protein [Rhodococcus pseudokoreensis]QSE92724.1 Fis family transcriptional regulator [Rhodococcus pseudokoreensis]
MSTILSARPVDDYASSGSNPRHLRRTEDDAAQLRRVRETFLTTGSADPRTIQAAGLSPSVLDSWRRCMRYGLDSIASRPVHTGDVDLDTPLTRVVDSIIRQREAVLEQSMCGLNLTDSEGVVLRQWVRDPALGRWFERHHVLPSVSVDETAVGTTSGICLLNERPTMVRGLEHFREEFASVTSAGVPIVHPVTHRLVGSLNLTSRYEDTSPVLLSWVMDLVRDVQRAYQETATRRERTLLDAYLTENRDTRHPLVALNDQTIITNATAARLLTSVDQALLWEHASRAIQESNPDPRQLVLTDGTVVSVRCREVSGASESAGAVLTIRPIMERKTREGAVIPAPKLAGLVGDGPRWRELCRRAAAAVAGPVLIIGEPGSGKVAVAKAIAGDAPVTVLDAAESTVNGAQAWLLRLERAVEESTGAIVIRRCDELQDAAAMSVANLIESHRNSTVRFLATATQSADHGQRVLLHAEFSAILKVPALRDRLEDLPVLLDALTRKANQRLGRAPADVRWMPDAVQALSRLEWHGNITSLETVVLRVLQGNSNRYINAGDLPTDVVASASRRKLARLEQVEANTIIAALREANGNKNRAAESLGIARSTLYRKVRALGIDLSTSAF